MKPKHGERQRRDPKNRIRNSTEKINRCYKYMLAERVKFDPSYSAYKNFFRRKAID